MYTRRQYYQYIRQIAMDIHQTIGDAYNDQVGAYLHSLLDHYPDRVDPKEVAEHVMKILGYDDDAPFDEIIDKAEEAIRQQNGGSLPIGALFQLRALRQKYGSRDGGDHS